MLDNIRLEFTFAAPHVCRNKKQLNLSNAWTQAVK